MKNIKYAAGLWAFSACVDRFCTTGYRETLTTEEKLRLASTVNNLTGVEMQYPSDFTDTDIDKIKSLLGKLGLECAVLQVDIFGDKKWRNGALTTYNEKLRREAIEASKKVIDIAEELKCERFNLWPGQDGFDYPFQANYDAHLSRLIEGITKIGEHNRDIKVCIEFKVKEPRVYSTVGSAAKSLLIALQTRLDNVGVTLDVGHALMGDESPAETAVLLSKWAKLFHLHFNDNHGRWDDDMIFGTVHFWDLLELIFWLNQVNYTGWYSLDIFPYREDPVKACQLSISNIDSMRKLLEKIDTAELMEGMRVSDAIKTTQIVRETIFKGI